MTNPLDEALKAVRSIAPQVDRQFTYRTQRENSMPETTLPAENSEFFGDKKYVSDMLKFTFEMGQQYALTGTLPAPNFDAAADHLLKCLGGYNEQN